MFKSISLSAFLLMNAALAHGQASAQTTSAAALVASYAAGNTKEPPRLAVLPCPAKSPRADSILVGVLTAARTPEHVADLSLHLGAVMEYCNDPRVQAWFRDRLAESNGEMFPTMHLVKGLLANPTSANVAAVRASLFRKSIATSETASEILAAYTRGVNMSHRSRIELFAEIYERAAALPEPYASIESFNLKRGPEGMFWRQRTLSALTNFPEHAAAHSLLAMLGTDATEDSRDPHWRQQFRAGLVQLEGNSKASRELRNGAAQMRRLLDRKHGK